MNDRHRTLQRYKKKMAARHKTQKELFFGDLGKALLNMYDAIAKTVEEVIKFIKNFVAEIQTMPEDAFQEKLASFGSELTDEQINLLREIREHENNDKPNSKGCNKLSMPE